MGYVSFASARGVFHRVFAAHFGCHYVVEFRAYQLFADCRDVVDIDFPLEVVAFVLYDAC